MEIRRFAPADEPEVVLLWERCGLTRPWNDPRKDIRRKLVVQAEAFLVGIVDGSVVATVMGGYEGHRGWINYLAVAPERQGQGLGRAMMLEVEELLRRAGCPKINLQVRATNSAVVQFYRRLGYEIDETISLGKRLESDDPV